VDIEMLLVYYVQQKNVQSMQDRIQPIEPKESVGSFE
jgi:hypothetical protein